MGHDHECRLALLVEFSQQGKQGFAGVRVQISRGFVSQDQIGSVNQRARHGHTLLLASGEFAGFVMQAVSQADFRKERTCFFDALGDRPFLHEAGEVGIFQGRKFRQEMMKLKHEPDAPVPKPGQFVFRQTEDILGFIEYRALRWSIQGSQNMEQGAFPRSRSPQHGHEFALPDFEIDAFQDLDGLIAQDERFG